jgi:hypothetical protein
LTSRLGIPVLTGDQLLAPFVLLKTPPAVPAYTVAVVSGSTTNARMARLVRFELTGVQLPAPFVLLNTPASDVPA